MHEVTQGEPSRFQARLVICGATYSEAVRCRVVLARANLNPPMAEHLSFRMGNQLFFIFVEAAGKMRSIEMPNRFSWVCRRRLALCPVS